MPNWFKAALKLLAQGLRVRLEAVGKLGGNQVK